MANALPVKFPRLQLGQPIQQQAPQVSRLRQELHKQHPIHNEFGEVYEQLGGQAHLKEWAEDNPTDFYRMFAAMAPKPQQVKHSGELKISLALQRNPHLDDFDGAQEADFDEVP